MRKNFWARAATFALRPPRPKVRVAEGVGRSCLGKASLLKGTYALLPITRDVNLSVHLAHCFPRGLK
jgi:hypothetical protein